MSDLIVDNPRDWILKTLFNADMPDYETFRVYTCLSRYISQNREFIGVELDEKYFNIASERINNEK